MDKRLEEIRDKLEKRKTAECFTPAFHCMSYSQAIDNLEYLLSVIDYLQEQRQELLASYEAEVKLTDKQQTELEKQAQELKEGRKQAFNEAIGIIAEVERNKWTEDHAANFFELRLALEKAKNK